MVIQGRSEQDTKPNIVEDEAFVERLRDRNPAAMEELVTRHHRGLYRFLYGLSRCAEDAEDLTQQTLVRAIEAIHRYDGRAALRTWLFGIAFREFCKLRRRRQWLPLLGDRPTGDDPFGRLVEAQALLDALAKLSNDAKGVFLLHHVEGMTIPEIAETLNVPEGTVKSRLFTARERLRTLLGEETAYAT